MINLLLIAIGLAMDSFGASIALGGISKKRVFTTGLVSSAMFGGFQAVMPIIGMIIGEAFKSFISGIDHWIAFILLSSVGLKMIYENLHKSKKLFNQRSINFRLIISLAFATSIDALIIGMGIVFIGVPILLAIALIGLITFLLSMVGIYLGTTSSRFLQNKVGIVGGLILITIGLKILTDHIFL